MRSSARLLVTWITLLAATVGCGGKDGAGPQQVAGGFTVALSSTTLSVEQGAVGTVTATIARTGSFQGTVRLTTENVPAGLTASFSPSAINSGTTSTTLTVAVAASVVPGAYTFTVRGEAQGITARPTATVTLTVTPKPSIALALSASSATVAQGQSAVVTATISRSGFVGAVGVAVSGLPAGVTSAVSTVADVHTITLAIAGSAAVGTYALGVTATGTGVSSTATFTLTVTVPPNGYSLAVTPTAISIPATQTGQVTVDLARVNFNGTVTLALEGAPTGVSGAFAPATVSGTTATLTLSIGLNAAPGTTALTVRGSAAGLPDRTATLTLTVLAAPSVALTLAPASLTLVRGGVGVSTTVNIARANFTGPVTITAPTVPGGVTMALATSPTTGNSVVATFTATNLILAGTYQVSVTASGSGIATVTAQLTLNVIDPSSISLSASPTAVSIAQGASAATTLTLGRTNFPDPVTLSATGVPSGVTVSFSTNQTSGNSVVATIAAAAGAAIGTSTITFQATGTGVATSTTSVSLTVTATATNGNVTYTFCDTQVPTWVAYRDGTNGWTRAVAASPNTYSFPVTSTGGVAWVTQVAAGEYELTLYFGSLAELQADGGSRCTNTDRKSHNGSFTGLSFGETASISMGGALATGAFATPSFSLSNVENVPLDIVAVRSAPAGLGRIANNVLLSRGINIPGGQFLGVFAFGGVGSIAPSTHTATVTGASGGEVVVGTNTFITATGSFGDLTTATGVSGAFTFAAVPTASSLATDLHVLSAQAALGSSAFRTVTTIFHTPANQSLALGATLASETVTTLATAPYARLRVQASRQSDYANAWTFAWSQGTTGNRRAGTIFATAAYLGAGATVDLAIPDFTGVTGWNSAWGPGTGGTYTFGAFGWNLGAAGAFAPRADGAVIRSALRLGSY